MANIELAKLGHRVTAIDNNKPFIKILFAPVKNERASDRITIPFSFVFGTIKYMFKFDVYIMEYSHQKTNLENVRKRKFFSTTTHVGNRTAQLHCNHDYAYRSSLSPSPILFSSPLTTSAERSEDKKK
jgi:hypothetical protein